MLLKDIELTWLGILLFAMATMKITFFDLQTLSIMIKSFAFIACGITMIVIAILRSRRSDIGKKIDDKKEKIDIL